MSKARIRDRAQQRCEYCRDPERLSLAVFHLEHVIARQHGGANDDENLALARPDCNLRKGPNLAALDPETGEMVRLFHPRRDNWEEHFQADGARLVGLTAIGRVTICLLELNTPQRLKHRRLLRQSADWQ